MPSYKHLFIIDFSHDYSPNHSRFSLNLAHMSCAIMVLLLIHFEVSEDAIAEWLKSRAHETARFHWQWDPRDFGFTAIFQVSLGQQVAALITKEDHCKNYSRPDLPGANHSTSFKPLFVSWCKERCSLYIAQVITVPYQKGLVSDIAIFVLKRDVKLQLTNIRKGNWSKLLQRFRKRTNLELEKPSQATVKTSHVEPVAQTVNSQIN